MLYLEVSGTQKPDTKKDKVMKLSAIIFSAFALLVPAVASADTHCAPVRHETARQEVRQEIRHDREVMRNRIRGAERVFHRDVREIRHDVRR